MIPTIGGKKMYCSTRSRRESFLSILVILLVLGLAIVLILPSEAEARVPYIYYWEVAPYENTGVKHLRIDFDYPIDTIDKSLITIREKGTVTRPLTLQEGQNGDYYIRPDGFNYKIDPHSMIFSFPLTSIRIDGDTIDIPTISGKYPDIRNWELIIPVGALTFTANSNYSQLADITIPFDIIDVEPGFKSTFMTATNNDINSRILANNSMRDIKLYLPTNVITGLQTIHRINPPQLSSIDITTKTGVDQLFIKVGNTPERRLIKNSAAKFFTSDYAGLDIGLNKDEKGDDIHLKAFDQYGKLLEERTFKLRMGLINKTGTDNYLINDYIPATTGTSLKNEYTLYDLVVVDPALAETILSVIPAGQLDNLRIFYPYKINTFIIRDLHDMATALASNISSKVLFLGNTFSPSTDICIDSPLRLNGKSYGLGFAPGKKLIIGNGTKNIDVILQNLNITGDLDIDVGAGGIVTLDNVSVSGTTTIYSGGINSIYLSNFRTGKLEIKNNTAVRVIAQGTTSLRTTTLDTTWPITLVLDLSSGTPSFGSITGRCPMLTWGAGNEFDMGNTAPNINIQGSITIDTGNNSNVNLDKISCNGSITTKSGELNVLKLSATTISESLRNDGSIDATLVVTQNKGSYNISSVTVENLPPGLSTSYSYDTPYQITITFTGKATHHQLADSINNARVILNGVNIGGVTNTFYSNPFSIKFLDNMVPGNQNTVFSKDITVKPGTPVTIASSGNVANEVWFAPLNTPVFTPGGPTMTKANTGTDTTILAPTSEGSYRLYIVEPGGNISAPSQAILTVDDTAPVFASGYPKSGAAQAIDSKKVEVLVQVNEPGTAYYVVVNNGVIPTANQVMDGPNYPGAFDSGNASITANTEKSFITAALPDHDNDYDVYIVVKDAAGNTTAATRIDVTTPVAKAVDFITIKTEPTVMTYVYGQTLNLTGLVITLTYNNNTTTDVPLAQFNTNNITTTPINGALLTLNDHDTPVRVIYNNSIIIETRKLIVNP